MAYTSHSFPFSSRVFIIALENSGYSQDVQISMFLLVCLLIAFQALFRLKQLFKDTTQITALSLSINSGRMCGTVQASMYDNGYLEYSGISLPNNFRILKNFVNIWK